MDREQTARLAGLAPCLNESARFKGERHICGGRARVRKTIFMAAFTGAMKWNPDLGVFCRRLMAKGKSRIKAVTACAGVRLGWNDVWTASCGGIAVCQAGGVENNSRKGDRP